MKQAKRTMYAKSMKGLEGEHTFRWSANREQNDIHLLVHSHHMDTIVEQCIAQNNAANTT